MRLPTGAIDQTFNLVHKGCGIVLMVLAIAFGFSAHHRIFGKDGTAGKIEQTMQHLSDSANSTHDLIAGESERQKALYDKLGGVVDQADGTIKAANSTITKLGTAIQVAQANLTATTGAVNGTLGQVQSTLAQVRTDAATANTAIAGIRPVLDQSHTDLEHLDSLIQDPSIKASLASIASTSKHVDGITGHVEGMAADSEIALHKAYHPSKWAVVRGVTVKGFFVWLSHF
jgi:hypothetical protein